jgi:hypothetical protein
MQEKEKKKYGKERQAHMQKNRNQWYGEITMHGNLKNKWIYFLQSFNKCTLRNLVHFETFRIVLHSVGCVMCLEASS